MNVSLKQFVFSVQNYKTLLKQRIGKSFKR